MSFLCACLVRLSTQLVVLSCLGSGGCQRSHVIISRQVGICGSGVKRELKKSIPSDPLQIITKMPGRDGNKLRRLTYFVNMCRKERSIGSSDWTRQPIISSPTRRAISPFLLGEHAHCQFTDPIDSLQLTFL